MAESRGSTGDAAGSSAGGMGGADQPAVEQIQGQAVRLVELGREQLNARLGAQKEAAAGTVATLATALREAGRQVREQDQGQVAQYVDAAAGQVERLAEALRTQDVDQLVATVGDYARRQPAPFLAAAFALGFAGMRFFRSSTPPRRDRAIVPYGAAGTGDWTDRYATGGYGTGYGYGSAGGFGSGYGAVGAEEVGYEATTPTAGAGLAGGLGLGSLDAEIEAVEVDVEAFDADTGGAPASGGRGAGVGGR